MVYNMVYFLFLVNFLLCHWCIVALTTYECKSGKEIYVDDPDYDITCSKGPAFNLTFGPSVQIITPVKASFIYGVTFSDSVTTIQNNAFINKASLQFISFGKGVQTIGSYAFYNAFLVSSLVIPDSVTSIGSSAFNAMFGLRYLKLGKSIETIGDNAFYGALVLTGSLVLPRALRNLGAFSFSNLASVESVTISEGLTYIPQYAFVGCGMTTLTLPNSLARIGPYAFGSLFNIKTINWGSGLSIIDDHAFHQIGTSIESLILPDSMTSIGDYAFANCKTECKLGSVIFGANVESIGAYAFAISDDAAVSMLTNIDFTGTKLQSFGSFAFAATSLTSVTLPKGILNTGNNTFADCADLATVQLPETLIGIGKEAFSNCTSLVSIGIPDSVAFIGEMAFSDSDALECLYWNPNIHRQIGLDAFNQCPLTGCGPSAVPTLRPTMSPTVSRMPSSSFVPTRRPTYTQSDAPSMEPTTLAPTRLGQDPKFAFTMQQNLKGLDEDTFWSRDDNREAFLAAVWYCSKGDTIVTIDISAVTDIVTSRRSLLGSDGNDDTPSIDIVYIVIFGANSFAEAKKMYTSLSQNIINATVDGSMTQYLRLSIALDMYDASRDMEDAEIDSAVVYESLVLIPPTDDDYDSEDKDDNMWDNDIWFVVATLGGFFGSIFVFMPFTALCVFLWNYKKYMKEWYEPKIVPDDESKRKYEILMQARRHAMESLPVNSPTHSSHINNNNKNNNNNNVTQMV